jgi:hypothetical protein
VADRTVHERALGPERRAADQRDVVAHVVLAFAREQRILLRAPDDQSRDHVNYPHVPASNVTV